jgi:hypothetical protein
MLQSSTSVDADSKISTLGHKCLASDLDLKAVYNRARQLRAVPVFMAETRGVEFIPEKEITTRTFSQGIRFEGTLLSMRFDNLDPNEAVRLIAASAGVDIVVPSELPGRVSGLFHDLTFRDALQLVAEKSGSDVEVQIDSNGLVRLVPRQ